MKQELLKGVRDVAPLLIGVIPFGVSSGLYAVEQGFTAFEAMFMSFVIFAGASQVATVGLMINEAPFWIIVATAILINLRFLIYSASVSPFVHKASKPMRALKSYLMTDHTFVLTAREKYTGQNKSFYFLGSGLLVWSVWQLSTFVGAFFGNIIPSEWSLEFSLPLVFLFFTLPLLKSRENIIAAIVAGAAAIILIPVMPVHSGLIVSILLGAFSGLAANKIFKQGVKNG